MRPNHCPPQPVDSEPKRLWTIKCNRPQGPLPVRTTLWPLESGFIKPQLREIKGNQDELSVPAKKITSRDQAHNPSIYWAIPQKRPQKHLQNTRKFCAKSNQCYVDYGLRTMDCER
jgi:hypothetical protein